ncbi:hypothetical protein [Nocardioides iriomotensis]|uniref:Fibronectin type-III domain-containing protein n=1 Tax=Nocardioides iriomotensis TaxID=715784 RepID=A0A4Q5JAN7_9ACTN|nr:hypothetical protein [Nocardioides iriomotensis]RYU14825.1 hypothetical protein ETU37_02220 [Nocardioides iriomotensis]
MTFRKIIAQVAAAACTLALLAVAPAITTPGVAAETKRDGWGAQRILKQDDRDTSVRVSTGRNGWALVARQRATCEECSTVHVLRERTPGMGWGKPRNVPARVSKLATGSNAKGTTWVAYYSGEGLVATQHTPRGRRLREPVVLARGRVSPSWETTPTVEVGTGGRVLVTFGETWYERSRDGTWSSYRTPSIDQQFTYLRGHGFTRAGDLLVFFSSWGPSAPSLMVSRKVDSAGATWSEPTRVGPAGTAQLAATALGERLVTRDDTGHAIRLYRYESTDAAGRPAFTLLRELPRSSPETPATTRFHSPVVLTDDDGTLTVAWREPMPRGGVMVFQEDRPSGQHLEYPTLVPGTRSVGEWSLVTDPMGNLSISYEDLDNALPRPARTRHLPAGKSAWTRTHRVISPKPTDRGEPLVLGPPASDGDIVAAMSDRAGVLAFDTRVPAPVTKVTRPVRHRVATREYRLAWNTTWANGDRWQVHFRTDKAGGYTRWRRLDIDPSSRSQTVTRPRGEKRCYQARARISTSGNWTPWSRARCVTVK